MFYAVASNGEPTVNNSHRTFKSNTVHNRNFQDSRHFFLYTKIFLVISIMLGLRAFFFNKQTCG